MKKEVFVRSEYNYDMDKASKESGLTCPDPTRTQQSFKDECDINTIVERFGLTGELPQLTRPPLSVDFEGVFDFQSAMNAIRAAEEAFASLPANLRARFQNNPAEFIAFCDDDKNLDEARRLGILAPKPPEEPKTEKIETKQGDTPKTP